MKIYLFVLTIVGSGLTLARSAQALPWNLQVRPSVVPNSCDSTLFQAELKITNTGTQATALSEIFPEFSFNAGASEIESVYTSGITAAIFDAQGAFVGSHGAQVSGPFPETPASFSPDRRTNQSWRLIFDPPSAGSPGTPVPPGGFATVVVALRRAGGQFPFDLGCDDFTRIPRNAPANFTDDRFFRLRFTSTQQLICERLNPTTTDPASGINQFPPFNASCP